MTDIRLDPADLRAAARIIRDACDRGGPPDDDTALADRLDLAAEAASRPPALSDWVRACEVSRLGAPTARVFDVSWWGFSFPRGHNVLLWTSGSDAGDADATVIPGGLSERAVYYDTPAALTAALDALCEVPRG